MCKNDGFRLLKKMKKVGNAGMLDGGATKSYPLCIPKRLHPLPGRSWRRFRDGTSPSARPDQGAEQPLMAWNPNEAGISCPVLPVRLCGSSQRICPAQPAPAGISLDGRRSRETGEIFPLREKNPAAGFPADQNLCKNDGFRLLESLQKVCNAGMLDGGATKSCPLCIPKRLHPSPGVQGAVFGQCAPGPAYSSMSTASTVLPFFRSE